MALTGGTLKSLLVRLGVDSSDFDKGMDHVEQRSGKVSGVFGGLATVGKGILMGAAGAAIAGSIAIGTLGHTALMAAGRVDQLIGVNRVLGENLGISEKLIREQSAAMRKQGIEAAIVEESLAKMMQANFDLAGATDIARIAQDSAVIAGTNSSESMSNIIHGITTLNPLVLRTQGLIIDQAAAYDKLAKSLDKSVVDLSAAEKQQAFLNAVQDAGAKIAGAYDESMKNPIKQLGSMKRLIDDVAVAAGGPLLEGFSSIIASLSDVVKWLGAAVDEGGELRPFLEQAGVWFSEIGEAVGEFLKTAIKNIPTFIDKMKKAFNWLRDNKGIVVGVFTAMGAAVLAFGVQVAIAAWTALVPLLPVIAIMLAIAAVAYLVYEAWTNNWGGIQEKVALAKEIIVGIIQTLTDRIVAIWNTFMSVVRPIIEAFQAAFSGDWYAFGEKIREAWDTAWALVQTALSNAFENIKTAVLEFIPKIKAFFTETDWAAVGLSIIKGIAKGITAAVGFIKTAARNAAKAAFQAAKGFLGIKSASTVFAGIGKDMMLGMAGGVSTFSGVPAGATVAATQNITSNVATAAPSGGGGGIDEVRLARLIRDAILQVID